MKKYQYILIDEKKVNINYKNIKNKGKRPYLILVPSISNNMFIAVPLTSKLSLKNKVKKMNNNWIEVNFYKDSYVKLDHITLFNKKDLIKFEETNKFLNRIEKKILNQKLQKIFILD